MQHCDVEQVIPNVDRMQLKKTTWTLVKHYIPSKRSICPEPLTQQHAIPLKTWILNKNHYT
jgi:hypothetical protein